MAEASKDQLARVDLVALGERIVGAARSAGADVAEASTGAGWELSAKVRLGEPELVEEAGTLGASLRVIRGGRVAVTSTSDLSDAGIERLVADAIELADLSEVDEHAGPADPDQLATPPFPELELHDDAVASVDAEGAIERAIAGEAAALGADPRLTLSEGATFARATSTSALVLSSGFSAELRGSHASLVVSPVAAEEDGKRRRGFYWTAARFLEDLESSEAVGREAARRTLAKLGARSLPTTEAAVIFEADAARSMLGTLAGCILGGSIWRRSSYLIDREGTEVASPSVTIVDDPHLARGFGSRPFDGEGLPTRRQTVVEGGVLKTFLLDCYSARKLGRSSTGHARRGGGVIGPGTSNFILQPGTISREELIRSTERGLYVTEMMGFGFNAVTGDFSRGAAGFWVENGELKQPVGEVTISGNFDTMLKQIDALANDLELKTSTAAPTFRVARMTIAGGG